MVVVRQRGAVAVAWIIATTRRHELLHPPDTSEVGDRYQAIRVEFVSAGRGGNGAADIAVVDLISCILRGWTGAEIRQRFYLRETRDVELPLPLISV